MLSKIKKYNYLFITALCAFIIIGVIFYLQEVAPVGKHSLLTVDFFHQYGPMMGELWTRVKNGSSLIYSFNMGLGLPFLRNFFNYLSSPFNIILFLFAKKDLLTSYSIIIGLKAVAASVTMAIFLSKKLDNKYLTIPLSLVYAFSAYFGAYYWNIMWLDGIVMLPLITIGIEKLIDDDKAIFYIVSLAITLFANYFIGYMICIFSCLYFITYLMLKKKSFNLKTIFKKCILFAIASLLSGGLCAFFLLPLYDGLQSISATKDAFPTSQYYDFTFKEFIFNHLSGVGNTVFKSDITNAPNISVGIISFMLSWLFIVNPKISARTKICYMSLLIVLFVSFIYAPLDFIWHAFHVPNDLPYRYSFIYSFILVLIASLSINKLKDVKKWLGTIIYALIMGFIYLSKELSFLNITRESITLNYALATIFYIGYMLCHFKKLKYSIIAIVTVACMGDIIYTIDNNWNIDQDMSSFYNDYDETEQLLDNIKTEDPGFYRIEREDMLTFNDPSWYDYRGMMAFSSMEYESNALLLYGLGAPSNEINSFYYKYNTPVYNTLFALNYIIGDTYLNGYEQFMESTNTDVYKNIYKGDLLYGVNNDIKNVALEDSPFLNQNNLIESMTSISDVLIPMKIKDEMTIYENNDHKIIKYYIKNNYDNIYLYFDDYDIDFIVFDNNAYYLSEDYHYGDNYFDEKIWRYIDYGEKYIISEVCTKDLIEVYVGYNYYDEENDNKGFEIYELDYDKWNAAYEKLHNNALIIEEFKENNIVANSNFEENRSVFTSIPYDTGWKVFIDQKGIDTYSIADSLLGFDVPSGDHKITLTYKIPYFKIGMLITFISIIGTILLNINLRRNSDK